MLPFLLFRLPYQLIRERYIVERKDQSPFEQNATLFQDIVIRVVRYAFANVPATIGRVFFSKYVALPFFRFRLLRNGYTQCPIPYREVITRDMRGLWMVYDASLEPDVVVYYCHGGGFSMGSSYFYLEFLIAWVARLKQSGFRNPAIFSLDYTLVPDRTWPVQYNETVAGYKYLCDLTGDSSKICLSGDSAGATLMLSLLLSMEQEGSVSSCGKPGLAILISPWTHLVSEYNRNTASDYLDRTSLHLYARQYVGVPPDSDLKKSSPGPDESRKASLDNDIISPGLNTKWKAASPSGGYFVVFGAEEVFAPGIKHMVESMKAVGAKVDVHMERAGIHAWPVVNLFLGRSLQERIKGLNIMSNFVASTMKPHI